MNTYSHARLNSSRSEIRLFQLEAGHFGNDVEGRLRHYPLNACPPYIALSYVWGDPKDKRPILLDGRSLFLTVNLFEALQHIRDENRPIMAWVDAICINQDDNDERSQQVQMMKVIFEAAECVIAWIGPSYNDSDIAMEYIAKFALPSANANELLHSAETSGPVVRNAVYDLFRRPYWERVWIVQELASACQARVRCGHQSVQLDDFHRFITELNKKAKTIANYMSVAKACRLLKLAKLYQDQCPHEQRLVDLLWSTIDFRATDSRDKIYAILGIARERDRLAIVPDYTNKNTFENLLRELVMHHVMTEGDFDILCYFPTFRDEQNGNACSWVPDLTQHLNGLCPQSFNANGARRPAVYFSQDLKLLTVKGLYLDKVDSVIGPFNFRLFKGFSGDHHVPSVFSEDATFNSMKRAALDALGHTYLGADAKLLHDIFWDKILSDKVQLGQDRPENPCPCGYLELWEAISPISCNSTPNVPDEISPKVRDTCGQKQLRCRVNDQDIDNVAHYFGPAFHYPPFLRLSNRCFFVTTSGMIGLGPTNLQKGDNVTIVFGCSLPIILREQGNYYGFVGPAYVHGAMNGEYVEDLTDNSAQIREFVLE
jgi:hypothetical protein